MEDNSKIKMRAKQAAITVAVTVTVLTIVHLALSSVGELWYKTQMGDAVALAMPFFTRVLIGFVAIAVVIGFGLNYSFRYRNQNTRRGAVLGAAGIGMFIVMMIPGLPFISAANRSGFEAQKSYLENLTVSSKAHPTYLVRQNYVQAQTILSETLNDSVVGGLTQLQYTSNGSEPAWCAGVLSVKDGKGRQYVNGVRCLTTAGRITKAEFKSRVPSFGGAFSTNLQKQIAEAKPGMSVDKMDVRYAIVDGSAISVVSLTRVEKNMNTPHRVPGGVMVFDNNGKMTYKSSVKAGEFDFAVVPYGTAEEIRNALNTRSGFWCQNHLTKQRCVAANQPLEDTHHMGGEEVQGDVNAANYSEFVLIRKDGTFAMVTPLTVYGKGRNVVAYLDVDAGAVQDGAIPKAVLYTGVMEVSNRMLAQVIAPAYTADITWINEVGGDGDMASGSRIYEVTPTKPGEVFATIGTATNPQYSVRVQASIKNDSLEFSWCVFDHLSQKQIECRARNQGEAPIGTLRGLVSQNNNNTDTDSVNVGSGFDTSKLSDQERLALIVQLAEELKD